jgi:hypothetical protein
LNAVKAVLDSLVDLNGVEVDHDLGGGAFGIVSRVSMDPPPLQDPNAKGVYAMKTIRADKIYNPLVLRNFFREVFTQLVATHPAIVPIYAWNVFKGTELSLSFLMPCYERGRLKDWIGKLGPT